MTSFDNLESKLSELLEEPLKTNFGSKKNLHWSNQTCIS